MKERKLSKEERQEIVRLYHMGLNRSLIARKVGRGMTAVSSLLRRYEEGNEVMQV